MRKGFGHPGYSHPVDPSFIGDLGYDFNFGHLFWFLSWRYRLAWETNL